VHGCDGRGRESERRAAARGHQQEPESDLSFALSQQVGCDCRRLRERKVHNLGQRHSHLDRRPFFAFPFLRQRVRSSRMRSDYYLISSASPQPAGCIRPSPAHHQAQRDPSTSIEGSSRRAGQTLSHAIVIIPSAHSTPHSSSYDSPTTRLMPLDRHVSTQRSSLPPHHQ
jgi:hypothetical protein